MSNVFAPMGELTIRDVFDYETETVYVVAAPNGEWSKAKPTGDLTAHLGEAREFRSREQAIDHADAMSARLRSCGAHEAESEFIVQEFTRTTIVSNFHNVAE